jgi:putative transposase
LTFCVAGRRQVFTNAVLAAKLVGQFLRVARFYSFELLAYCVMPDHALLARGLAGNADLCRFVRSVQRHSGQAYAHKTHRPLWQPGYFERVLRRDEDVITATRYIIWNPVRAGLVDSPRNYPHLGSDVWSLDELLEP